MRIKTNLKAFESNKNSKKCVFLSFFLISFLQIGSLVRDINQKRNHCEKNTFATTLSSRRSMCCFIDQQFFLLIVASFHHVCDRLKLALTNKLLSFSGPAESLKFVGGCIEISKSLFAMFSSKFEKKHANFSKNRWAIAPPAPQAPPALVGVPHFTTGNTNLLCKASKIFCSEKKAYQYL